MPPLTASHRAASAAIALLSASLVSCRDGSSPPAASEVQATQGGGQVAPVRTVLPAPIVATVLDAAGAPLPGVRVTWGVDGEGRIHPVNNVTDAQGRSQARWVLGGHIGPNTATARVPGVAPAAFTAIAESADEIPYGSLRVLRVPSYEVSGQVVHPDYAASPAGAFRHPHHLAITPYPFGDPAYENPSLFAGDRADHWLLEPGAPNPVVLPAAGYLSDPDIVYLPDADELWLYYRQSAASNIIYLIRSQDGVTWTGREEVARAPNHDIVSPTVVRREAGDWWMWSVKSGPAGCDATETTVELRRSTDGRNWSGPTTVDLSQPDLWPWHIEVQWIPSRQEFWALYNAKTARTCTSPALLLATSPDGVTWTVMGQPVLSKGRVPEFQDIVYRSTFSYDPLTDAVTFWYSGARYEGSNYVWRTAV
ncbi:MAG: hypothetical protein ACREMX_08415, partial [Gemmatimonadales bacterium]